MGIWWQGRLSIVDKNAKRKFLIWIKVSSEKTISRTHFSLVSMVNLYQWEITLIKKDRLIFELSSMEVKVLHGIFLGQSNCMRSLQTTKFYYALHMQDLWLCKWLLIVNNHWENTWAPGPDSILRWRLTCIGNPIVEIRRSYDRLISTMGFPILVRLHLYIESGPGGDWLPVCWWTELIWIHIAPWWKCNSWWYRACSHDRQN